MKKLLAISNGLIILLLNDALADTPPDNALVACNKAGKECVAVGTVPDVCFESNKPAAFISHDGKQTWQKATITDNNGCAQVVLSSLKCRDDLQRCVLFGSLYFGHDHTEFQSVMVLTSDDAGNHWLAQNISCGGLSFASTNLSGYYCNASWSNCVAVGSCTHGVGDDRIYPVSIYLAESNSWSWSSGLDKIANYVSLKSVICSQENAKVNLNCCATGSASDNGSKWWNITVSSKDSGKNWTYIHDKKAAYKFAKHPLFF